MWPRWILAAAFFVRRSARYLSRPGTTKDHQRIAGNPLQRFFLLALALVFERASPQNCEDGFGGFVAWHCVHFSHPFVVNYSPGPKKLGECWRSSESPVIWSISANLYHGGDAPTGVRTGWRRC